MSPARSPPLPLFAVLSLALHGATFAALASTGARGASVRAFDPSSQTLAGDTLDIEPPSPAAQQDEDIASTSTPTPTATATATPTSTSNSTPAHRDIARAAGTAVSAAAAPPALYGALGVRFATDLATTFTRAFPQAASADLVWSGVPFGSAGRAQLTLVLDDEGQLARTEIAGSPSPALRRSIERTLVLLAPRAFTARGAVTRLSVAAHVSRDDVHDGFHGDVFALSAGSFSGEVGAAFFALPPSTGPGRRVDVEVRLLP